MTDDQRDEILTALQVSLARVETTLGALPEKLTTAQIQRTEILKKADRHEERLQKLERWRAEASGRDSGRGSAFAVVSAIIAALAAIGSAIASFL